MGPFLCGTMVNILHWTVLGITMVNIQYLTVLFGTMVNIQYWTGFRYYHGKYLILDRFMWYPDTCVRLVSFKQSLYVSLDITIFHERLSINWFDIKRGENKS